MLTPLTLLALAGTALADDSDIIPSALTSSGDDFSTTATIEGATSIAKTGGTKNPKIKEATSGYTLTGSGDSMSVAASILVTVECEGDLLDENNGEMLQLYFNSADYVTDSVMAFSLTYSITGDDFVRLMVGIRSGSDAPELNLTNPSKSMDSLLGGTTVNEYMVV